MQEGLDDVPPRLMRASSHPLGMDHLVTKAAGRNDLYGFEPGTRMLFDTVLPPFQRPLKWDEGQMVRFVESAWMGLHLGVYTVNYADDDGRKVDDGAFRWHHTHMWLIDGQQRLTALSRYLDDKLAVRGRNGLERFWSEIHPRQQRRFKTIAFERTIVRCTDENLLAFLYDRCAFGGTPHEPWERAVQNPEHEPWSPSKGAA